MWESNVYFHVLGLVREYIMTGITKISHGLWNNCIYPSTRHLHYFFKAFLLKNLHIMYKINKNYLKTVKWSTVKHSKNSISFAHKQIT